MPDVPMRGIVLHWTAGSYNPSEHDRRAYHILIDGDGKPHRGTPSIALNSGTLKPGYAAHTLNCNTGFIGVSICSMGGAKESPFDAGVWPLRRLQMDAAVQVLADLCEKYDISPTRKSVLSHAEVQSSLGIRQRSKWDIARLAYDLDRRGAHEIGDAVRREVSALLMAAPSGGPAPIDVDDLREVVSAGGVGIVSAKSGLLMRRSGSPEAERIGSIPDGTQLVIVEVGAGPSVGWLRVRTPAGYTGWVSGAHVVLADGPPPELPTTPNPAREYLDRMRTLLDDMEKLL